MPFPLTIMTNNKHIRTANIHNGLRLTTNNDNDCNDGQPVMMIANDDDNDNNNQTCILTNKTKQLSSPPFFPPPQLQLAKIATPSKYKKVYFRSEKKLVDGAFHSPSNEQDEKKSLVKPFSSGVQRRSSRGKFGSNCCIFALAS